MTTSGDNIREPETGRHRAERWKYAILLLFSALYFSLTFFFAAHKLFWFDEIVTAYIARLPGMADVWRVLRDGIDFNPPLFFALTRFFESLWGQGQIVTRMPEILGFWILCLCLFRFVSIRTSVLAGTVTLLFPLVTTDYYYAYEARPHGIVLGFAGLALVCWQAATRSNRSRWWLIGLFGALLGGILCHTYAIILLVPFALAELFRLVSTRRTDWPLWLAILGPLSGIIGSLPLIGASKVNLPGNFSEARFVVLADAYQFHLTSAVGIIAAALILYFVCSQSANPTSDSLPEKASIDLYERIVLIGFVAMPVTAFLLARLTHSPFIHRYSATTIIGVSCILGIMLAKRPAACMGLVGCMLLQVAIHYVQFTHEGVVTEPVTSLPIQNRGELEGQFRVLEEIPGGSSSPILLLDIRRDLPLVYYAPPDLVSRMFVSSAGTDFIGAGYDRLHQCCGSPARFRNYSEALAKRESFIAVCSNRLHAWLDEAISAGADVSIVKEYTQDLIVRVTFK